MRFILKKIILNYFKGIEKMEVSFSPDTTLIEGDNETGKTTLYDAFCYCMSKKASDGSTDFGIKPNFITEIVSPSVEIEAEIDRKPVSLKRVYQAKFTRDKKFSGYKTECFINGIPTGTTDFEKYISSTVGEEEVFKLLTFPNYFTELMTPAKGETVSQRQCKALKKMASVESDKSIAESNESFQPLVELLDRYDSVDDIQRFYKAEVKRIHQEIDDIPVRVEQQAKNIWEVKKTKGQLTQELNSVVAKLDAINSLVVKEPEEESNQVASLKKDIAEVQKEVSELNGKKDRTLYEKKNEQIERLIEVKDARQEATTDRKSCEIEINKLLERLNDLSVEKDVVKQEGKLLKNKSEELLQKMYDAECPYCGTPLTGDKKIEYASKCQEEIDSIESSIESKKMKWSKLRQEEKEAETKIEELRDKVRSLNQKIQDAETREKQMSSEYQESVKKIAEQCADEIVKKNSELAVMEEALIRANERLDDAVKQKFSEINFERDSLTKEKDSIVSELNKIGVNEKSQQLIAELEASRDKFNDELDKAQMYLDLSEEFIKERSSLLEESVNKLFNVVKFKFTRENKSGKVSESCTPTFNGQNYQDLSASTKLICNLDIVNGFQRYYNAYLPLFVDNAEGITETLKNSSQTVLLAVKKECCPVCGGETGRKQENGFWKCKNCGNEFRKHMTVTMIGGNADNE